MPNVANIPALLDHGPSLEFICQPGDREYRIQIDAIYNTLYLIHLLFDPIPTPPHPNTRGLPYYDFQTRI